MRRAGRERDAREPAKADHIDGRQTRYGESRLSQGQQRIGNDL
jgi:hypothetical protein